MQNPLDVCNSLMISHQVFGFWEKNSGEKNPKRIEVNALIDIKQMALYVEAILAN